MSTGAIKTDIAIIGAGPVGLFAVFEAGLLGMKCCVIDAGDSIGGQCTMLYPQKPIYDIPAIPSITAANLIENLHKQIEPYSPTFLFNSSAEKLEKIEKLDNLDIADSPTEKGNISNSRDSDNNANNTNDEGEKQPLFVLTANNGVRVESRAVVIACGGGFFVPSRPPIEGIEKYEGKSVLYSVRDTSIFQGKRVVIAGGGDSAVDWAIELSQIADYVCVIHRRDKFKCAPDSLAKLRKLAEDGKIDLKIPFQLDSISGDKSHDCNLKSVTIANIGTAERETIDADFLLPFFGTQSNLGEINRWGLNIDKKTVLVNQSTCETNIKGVFAIGDVCHYDGKLKLILTGFAEAAHAMHAAYAYVNPNKALHFEHSTTKCAAK